MAYPRDLSWIGSYRQISAARMAGLIAVGAPAPEGAAVRAREPCASLGVHTPRLLSGHLARGCGVGRVLAVCRISRALP